MGFKIDLNKAAEIAKKVQNKAQDLAKDSAEAAKNTAVKAKDAVGEGIEEFRFKMMNPIFDDFLTSGQCKTPQLVRVINDDKRRNDPLCEGSIGFIDEKKGLEVLNIYQDCLDKFEYNFYPSLINDQLYYFEPNRTNSFVRLTEYFTEMQKSKFAELEQIAYKLGAKHYVISISEEVYKMTSTKVKAGVSKPKKGGPKADGDYGDKEETEIKTTIGAEKRFTGSSTPERPELVWFKNDQQLLSLIDMRCSGGEKHDLEYNRLVFDCKSTSVITMDLGIKLDAVIKDYGVKTSFSVKRAVEEEYRKKLIFNIEF